MQIKENALVSLVHNLTLEEKSLTYLHLKDTIYRSC